MSSSNCIWKGTDGSLSLQGAFPGHVAVADAAVVLVALMLLGGVVPQEAGYCCRGTDGCNAVMRLTVQDELWAAVNRGDGAVVRQHLTPLRLIPTEVRSCIGSVGGWEAAKPASSNDKVA
jgi:hypothetical protein